MIVRILGEGQYVLAEADVPGLNALDAILPPADASLDEVRGLLVDDGLIPG